MTCLETIKTYCNFQNNHVFVEIRAFVVRVEQTLHMSAGEPYLSPLVIGLVGCWSSVSIRIIYKFLNVCPFDSTAVAISGKVGRP